jgi:GNAT superfamily N-acetyltransferase
VGEEFAGCGSFWPLAPGTCEMHQVYVRPAFRGRGIGAQLVARLIEEAARAGYGAMRLETATFMPHAQAIYGAFGFRPCEPYRNVPAELAAITIPMERSLGR